MSRPIPDLSDPDRLFVGARFYTMADGLMRTATAVAVRGERILAVDGAEHLLSLTGKGTEIIDLGGAFVLPGFIETHAHPLIWAVTRENVNAGTPPNSTIVDVLARIREAAARVPEGTWIRGMHYDATLIGERRHITAQDLDVAAPRHPIFIRHVGGHVAYANSLALKLAGITEDTPDPHGGHIVRDPQGRLTGELQELGAQNLVHRLLPPYSAEEYRAAIPKLAEHFLAGGVTTVHDTGVGFFPGMMEAYEEAAASGRLPLRVRMFPLWRFLDELEVRTGFGNDRLRIGALKLVSDGSIYTHTASLLDPYADLPQDYGIQTQSQAELDDLVLRAHRAGWQIAIHANGDRAIEYSLNAIEGALRQFPREDHRHRIEHCQVVREEQLARMATLGVCASFHVTHIYHFGDRHRSIFLGPERAARISPIRSAIDHGVHYALHSDEPAIPVPFDPLFHMWMTVNRLTRGGEVLGPDQRISVLEALRGYTTEGAYLGFEEGEKGSLEPGKLADMVVLGRDPFDVHPSEIKDIPVEKTIVGGQIAYANRTATASR